MLIAQDTLSDFRTVVVLLNAAHVMLLYNDPNCFELADLNVAKTADAFEGVSFSIMFSKSSCANDENAVPKIIISIAILFMLVIFISLRNPIFNNSDL